MNIMNFMIVGVGGFFGAVSRFVVSQRLNKEGQGAFPFGTLLVNTLGCILLGIAANLALTGSQKLLLITGFIGSFTTFSTFIMESRRLNEHRTRDSLFYVAVSILCGLAGILLGMEIVRFLQ